MMYRHLSLKVILLLITGALTLLIVSLTVGRVYFEWQHLARIRALKAAVILSDDLFDTAEKLSVERDIAFSMLHARDEGSINALHARLETSRQEVDKALNVTLEGLKKYDFPELNILFRKSSAQFAAIRDLRDRIDQTMLLPAQARDFALPERWFKEVTDLILQTQEGWLAFIRHFTDVDPTVTLHMRFKYYLGIITEYTGRERSLIGRLIVENTNPTPEEIAQLLRWQGTVELAWSSSSTLADQSKLSPAITPYLKDAQSHYLTLYDMVKDIFYLPGAKQGASYPLTVEQWLELATEATDSLYALKDAALQETHHYVEMLEAQTQRTITVHALILLFALLMCCYSFRVILRRVIHPINDMVEALLGATEGKTVSLASYAVGRQDEIGKLARVLHVFQENVEKVKKSQKASALLAAIVESSEDAILSKTLDGIISSWNKGAQHLFGYSAAEAVGQHVSLIIPAERLEEESHIVAQLKEGKPLEHFETQRRHKDGHAIDISLTVSPVREPSGRIIGASKILRDITGQKKAEANLLRYTNALERSNQELDDFAYIASHDLKEPLRGLFNHASFLIEDYQDKLDADGVRRLHRLSHLSQRMEHLVNDLLYFSRLGRAELAIQETDIGEIIQEIEQLMESFLKERGARIIIPRPIPSIVCDKPRITEVFRNLITNAVKYNDKPERLIEVGFLDYVDTKAGREQNVFYVKDNGIGIEREFYQEIFRIFKRLQPAEGKETGTGVGLTFVKKIIERHGGHIWLDSEPGKGTTFYFNLKEGS